MNTLREAAQQALKALAGYRRHIGDTQPCDAEIALLAALEQTAPQQDPELSAALGYPGGISDPVLNRVELLRMVAEMRLAQPAAPQ